MSGTDERAVPQFVTSFDPLHGMGQLSLAVPLADPGPSDEPVAGCQRQQQQGNDDGCQRHRAGKAKSFQANCRHSGCVLSVARLSIVPTLHHGKVS